MTELFHLSADERHAFMSDVATVAETIQQLSQAQKINYAIYGDVVSHLHVHLVPKRPDSPQWGLPFVTDPATAMKMNEPEHRQLSERIAQALLANGLVP